MNIHLKFKTWHLDASLHRRQPVLGVNSILENGKHFLMWDFDNVPLQDVLNELHSKQEMYGLPAIYVVCSSVKGNYHAYCLAKRPWAQVVAILVQTEYLDQQYFKLGIMRGYFTLRWTDKRGSYISAVCTLESQFPNEATWAEMQNFERYYTRRVKHGK